MRDFITVDREANAIRLRRSAFLETFMLVEGSSDKVFYQRFVDEINCKLINVSGKPSSKLRVIKVLEVLNKSSFDGILAIVDADFDHLETLSYNNPNLLRTDTHDLETTLIKSFALEKVIAEFGSEEKIDKFNQENNIRKALIEAGIVIGYLRWVSQVENLNFTFSSIEFSKFIDVNSLQINELKLIQEVKNKSQALSWQNNDLKQLLINKQNSEHDPWQVCCGHDLVRILSFALHKTIGTNNTKEVHPDILERSLRLAYETVYFTKTEIYRNICIWEKNNQPFKVL